MLREIAIYRLNERFGRRWYCWGITFNELAYMAEDWLAEQEKEVWAL